MAECLALQKLDEGEREACGDCVVGTVDGYGGSSSASTVTGLGDMCCS